MSCKKKPLLCWKTAAGCLDSRALKAHLQGLNTVQRASCAYWEGRAARKIIFPLPGRALNSNEGGTETWHYRRIINTHVHTHVHTPRLPLHVPNHLPSHRPIYFEHRPSNALSEWVMAGYQSENDSVRLYCAKHQSEGTSDQRSSLWPRDTTGFTLWCTCIHI